MSYTHLTRTRKNRNLTGRRLIYTNDYP